MDFGDPGGGGMPGMGEGGGMDGVENGNGNAEGGSEYSTDYDGIIVLSMNRMKLSHWRECC